MSGRSGHALRLQIALGLGVLAIALGVVLSRRGSGRARLSSVSATAAGTNESCAEGLEPMAGGCFAEAPRASGPSPLLVYLHGRYAPEGADEERARQTRVARLGTARGYSVLALRGTQGQCSDAQLATWWCWPSNERNASDGPAFVARWDAALREASRRAGSARRVLLGFSNGGYFAALIASRALLPFDAVAIAHAGPVQPMHPAGLMPPILLVDADDDPSGPEMDRLDADLTREAWPHAFVAREGGHDLPEWDVTMSLTFFDRTANASLPLDPPLSTRPRILHAEPEASVPAPETETRGAPAATASDDAGDDDAPAAQAASATATAPPEPPDPSPPGSVLSP